MATNQVWPTLSLFEYQGERLIALGGKTRPNAVLSIANLGPLGSPAHAGIDHLHKACGVF